MMIMKKSIALVCCALALAGIAAWIGTPAALAASAPIHVTDDVNLRAGTDASTARVGGLYRGTSPSFNCWAQGQNVNGVDIWFNVTYNGVTGYYASFFDDSSYATDAQITSKYRIRPCGESSAPVAPQVPATVAASVSVYFSPYGQGSHELNDQTVGTVYRPKWYGGGCAPAAASVARATVGQRPIDTLSGWSLGRVGVVRYLASASDDELRRVDYAILIDPGTYDELSCDRQLRAGVVLAHWLAVNPSAHLVVVSGSQVSQHERSRGIQESYFNAIRNQSAPPRLNLRPRVLTCNYTITHQEAFAAAQYWIQHQIGTASCPTLRTGGKSFGATAHWHP
jgi:hypothetical protein